jgi:hypothetical protein
VTFSSRTATPDTSGPLHGSAPAGRRPWTPTRGDLAHATLLHAGDRDKADLWLAERDGQAVVVKDFARKGGLVRSIGRLQVARECRAYRRLDGTAGLPRFHGRVDRWALAIERVDAYPLIHRWRSHEPASLLRQLGEIVARMHAAGVVHLDLRSRDNVLVDPAGRVFVVDFASAVCLRPGGLGHRALFRWLSLTDASALLKWKRIMASDGLTEEELAFLERHRFWRRLWPVKR